MTVNCEKCNENLVLYVEGLLAEPERQAVESHLERCPVCRAELQEIGGLRDRLMADSKAMKDSNIEQLVVDRLKQQQSGVPRQGENVAYGRTLWRIIMENRISKLAAAAVIVVVLAVLYFTAGPDMAGVAWGQLADRVSQIQTCIFRGRQTTRIVDANNEQVQEVEMEVFVSSEYGMRSNVYMDGKAQMRQYALLQDKAIISVMPEQKRYMKMLLTEEHMDKMRKQGSDPREIVKQFTSAEYAELGRSTIDGIGVEGIETTDPKVFGGQFGDCVGRLWVDVDTQLPVRIEMEITMEAAGKTVQTSMVMYDFQWDVEIDPVVFEPNIPDDYTSMGQMKLPEQNEASAVEGLRLYSEITDGNYPASMTMTEVQAELAKLVMEKYKKEHPEFDRNSNVEQDALTSEMMNTAMKVAGACMFYAKLVQEDKDPAYYGDRVTATDVSAVLMRWRISDGLYRVIFGDLRTENMTAERLAELEAALPEQQP